MNDDIAKLFDLTGQVAVLTGAGSGVGRAAALRLGGAGAKLVLADIDEGRLEETAGLLGEGLANALLVRADVTKQTEVEALVARAIEQFGRLDIMGNIAGVRQMIKVVELTEQDLDDIMAINFKSAVFGMKAALRVMIPQRSGCIINISSQAIDTPAEYYGGYSASKAAVAMLTKTAAVEAAPHNVRVNAIAPGWLDTNFRPWNSEEEHRAGVAQWDRTFPLGRSGTGDDIARTIHYLCSGAASWVTGQILRPNGGSAMPW